MRIVMARDILKKWSILGISAKFASVCVGYQSTLSSNMLAIVAICYLTDT